MDLMFSIPVHEKPEVIIDQIINFQYYNPDCGIVLHISDKFDFSKESMSRDRFKRIINELGNVFINPETVRTGRSDIIQAHISNFRYADKVADFEKFCLCASNELFVKEGLADHVKPYDCGLERIRLAKYGDTDFSKEYYYTFRTVGDTALKGILDENHAEDIYFSHVEGVFFNRSLFSKMIDVIEKHYDYKSVEIKYPREEVYFASYIWNLRDIDGLKVLNEGTFTYVPWDRVGYMIWTEDVKKLQNQYSNKFSVKRVDRILNTYMRKYIRKNSGYYETEMKVLGDVVTVGQLLKSRIIDEYKEKFKVKKNLKLDRIMRR